MFSNLWNLTYNIVASIVVVFVVVVVVVIIYLFIVCHKELVLIQSVLCTHTHIYLYSHNTLYQTFKTFFFHFISTKRRRTIFLGKTSCQFSYHVNIFHYMNVNCAYMWINRILHIYNYYIIMPPPTHYATQQRHHL